jgi:pimeloyl-ACP methyl ester carboxylesterase
LVLIPGSHQDFRQYDEVVAHLDRDLGIIIVELPGHGNSHEIPDAPCIERFADDVIGAIRAHGVTDFFVGGHSIGGMIGLEVGNRQPKGIRGIISIEGWTHFTVADEALGGQACMYVTLAPEQIEKQNHLRNLATGHWATEEKRLFSGLWTRWNGEIFLQTTSLPVLELWGDRNRPVPSRAAMRIPDRPNIILKWFTDASHNLPLERPLELAHAITEFIIACQRGANLDITIPRIGDPAVPEG